MSDHSYLVLNVGGFPYKIKQNMLLEFPDSFFSKMMKSGWKDDSGSIVEIQRNGELFKFVHDYMFYGKLPRDEFGVALHLDDDRSLLKEVMQEAEFYNLPGLVRECEKLLNVCKVEQFVKIYATMLDQIGYGGARGNKVYYNEVVYKKTGPDSCCGPILMLRHG